MFIQLAKHPHTVRSHTNIRCLLMYQGESGEGSLPRVGERRIARILLCYKSELEMCFI